MVREDAMMIITVLNVRNQALVGAVLGIAVILFSAVVLGDARVMIAVNLMDWNLSVIPIVKIHPPERDIVTITKHVLKTMKTKAITVLIIALMIIQQILTAQI
jgi:hypothetical protein